ncbi:MAG TPA: CHRD domain-containing protein [Pyrinomonadaceae bacterium]|nr:CHRD domain-containing protein [Pyrinomonadaceae bacterium]
MRNVLHIALFLMLFVVAAVAQEDSGRKLSAALTGAAEVPGPGDTDGSGTALIQINQGQTQVCFELSVLKIDTPNAAHIHEGAVGTAGPVVVTLTAPGANGTSKGCVDASKELIMRLRQTPENFYVNVHNAAFPNGAVRGQLAKGS